jgi:anti-sigma regulatory factor (Ser/Thr protein kinase)
VPANLSAPSRIRQFLHQQAAKVGLPDDVTADLLIAASEAANNALQHTLTPTIECRWQLANGYVEVEIRDQGVHGPVLNSGGGGQERWGFCLMAAVADEVRVHPGTAKYPGTSVQFLKIVPGVKRTPASP